MAPVPPWPWPDQEAIETFLKASYAVTVTPTFNGPALRVEASSIPRSIEPSLEPLPLPEERTT
jgi:hypothetical protein